MNQETLGTFTYGGKTIDADSLPITTVRAMFKRGLTHYLGSEQASKVSGFFDPDQENPPEDTPEARAAYKAECVAKAIAALEAGTVGVSNRGPAVDPLTTIIRRLAKAEIIPILKRNGLAWPKKAEDTLDIGGEKVTGSQLIDRRLDPNHRAGVDAETGKPHLERLTKEAEKVRADQEKKAKKAAEGAEGKGLDVL